MTATETPNAHRSVCGVKLALLVAGTDMISTEESLPLIGPVARVRA